MGTSEIEGELRGHDAEEVDSLVSYRPSGHALVKDKGFMVVNRRPPTMPTNAWGSIGPVVRLDCLNAYRNTLNLREAKTWEEAVIYLTEEHLPSKLPATHKFPWGAIAPKGTVARHDDDGTEIENTEESDKPRDVDGKVAAAITDTRYNDNRDVQRYRFHDTCENNWETYKEELMRRHTGEHDPESGEGFCDHCRGSSHEECISFAHVCPQIMSQETRGDMIDKGWSHEKMRK